MGVDLTLMPTLHEEPRPAINESWLSHDLWPLQRRRDLWEAIDFLEPLAVNAPVICFFGRQPNGERGYGDVTRDDYDQPLTWLPAGVLARLATHPDVMDNHRNRAAWAALGAMKGCHPVVLYWG